MTNLNIPKYTLITYSRDKYGDPTGVLVAIPNGEEGGFCIGYAKCRSGDRFNKKMGLTIAIGRATFDSMHYHSDYLDKMPHTLRSMLPNFIKRCEKYYKKKQ